MAKKKKKLTKFSRPLLRYPMKSTDVPVTKTMLFEVRDELKVDIGSVRFEVRALSGRMDGLEGRMQSFEETMSNRMAAFEERVSSQIHGIRLLIEEQNARNIIVLDALTGLFARQERLENRQEVLERDWSNFTKAK